MNDYSKTGLYDSNNKIEILKCMFHNYNTNSDIIKDYDSHMSNILKMVKESMTISRYNNNNERTYSISLKNLFWVRPYKPFEGFVDMETTCVSGSLENELRADIIYEIKNEKTKDVEWFRECSRKKIFSLPSLNGSFSSSIRNESAMHTNFKVMDFTLPIFNVEGSLKICLLDEIALNNYVYQTNVPGRVECRHGYFGDSKLYRTNNTIYYSIQFTKMLDNTFRNSLIMEIPYEKPKIHLPVVYIMIILGLKIKEGIFIQRTIQHQVVKQMIEEFDRTNLEKSVNYVWNLIPVCKRRFNSCITSNLDMFKKTKILIDLFQNEYFPNLYYKKSKEMGDKRLSYYFYQIIRRVIDPTINKEKENYVLSTPGNQIGILVKKFIKKKVINRMVKKMFSLGEVEIDKIIEPDIFNLSACVRNGNWDPHNTVSDFNKNKTQNVLTGYGYESVEHQINKICRHSLRKNMKQGSLGISPKQFGRICMYSTPESEKCGIIQHKACGSLLSECIDLDVVNLVIDKLINTRKEYIGWTPVSEMNKNIDNKNTTVVIDTFGGVIGSISDVTRFYNLLVETRRKSIIHPHVSFEYFEDSDEFRIQCQSGRLLRGLLVCSKLKSTTLDEIRRQQDSRNFMTSNGMVEWLSCKEEYSIFVNVTSDNNIEGYTHVDIHGLLSMTKLVCQPFNTFNQGVRRLQTGNMMSRSIRLKPFIDFSAGKDYQLVHGQKPLVTEPLTRISDKFRSCTSGYNSIVAINAMTCNQEDAWVISKKFLELGGLSTINTDIVTVRTHKMSRIEKPTVETLCKHKFDKYHAIKDSGLPRLGSTLRKGDAVVGQVMVKNNITRCISRFLETEGEYRVSKVYCHPSQSKPHYIRVHLTNIHTPEVGDKFFFAHGQKGTCGEIRNSEDMPFVSTGCMKGTTADIVINVTSLSRNTTGLLLEMLFGKVLCLDSECVPDYDTIFTDNDDMKSRIKTVENILTRHGMNANGKHEMIDGVTGVSIVNDIFTGIAYTHVLNHLSKDKLRYRERGPVNELTRQPTSGRRLHGGQKIGEMENWNIYSYGMSKMFRNLNYECSDRFVIYMCKICCKQVLACVNVAYYFCYTCDRDDSIVSVNIPYTTNLFVQELFAAGLGHKLLL